MPTYVYQCDKHLRREEITKPMDESGLPEFCVLCEEAYDGPRDLHVTWGYTDPMRRIFTPPLKQIIRPSGWRLSPDDPKFSDFRREMELGELKDDATPVRFSPADLARFDDMPVELPRDPERDAKLAQLHHQHWTEDLSDDTVRRRELVAAAAARGELTPD